MKDFCAGGKKFGKMANLLENIVRKTSEVKKENHTAFYKQFSPEN
jgi:hypothetical protein